MPIKPTIFLLGGSGLGPWVWDRVVEKLQEQGLRTRTPQLSATGTDRTPPAEVSLDRWRDDLLSSLADVDADDAVLVAHSFAGYVAAAALEHRPDSVRTVIFLDAALPAPGRSWFDTAGVETATFMRSIAEDGATPFFTKDQLDHLYPGHGISDEDWAWMRANVTAQPLKTYEQPATMRELDPDRHELSYVRCARTVPPAAPIDENTPGWAFRTLPSGHWSMVTDPASVAAVVAELVGP